VLLLTALERGDARALQQLHHITLLPSLDAWLVAEPRE
jgi:hypothetical protein